MFQKIFWMTFFISALLSQSMYAGDWKSVTNTCKIESGYTPVDIDSEGAYIKIKAKNNKSSELVLFVCNLRGKPFLKALIATE